MTTVYLIRHGTTDWNQNGLFQGITDVPLNQTGVQQAALLGERFKDIHLDAVYSSPLTRTRQTTAGLCAYKPEMLPIFRDDLVEINGGIFEGRPAEENLANYPDIFPMILTDPSRFVPPEGESMHHVYERITHAMAEIVLENVGKTIAVVCHGCCIQNYLHYFSGKPFEELPRLVVANTAVTHITYDNPPMGTLHYIGDSSHLPPELFVESKFKNNVPAKEMELAQR